jgi:muconolactone D-isomerase
LEFIVEIQITVPSETDPRRVDELRLAESLRAVQLAASGSLVRLWKPQSDGNQWRNVGIWRANDETELRQTLSTLPLFPWMSIVVKPLLPHPSDPGQK